MNANELGLEKIKSSGLDLTDAKKLGFEFLSGPATAKHHTSFKPLCSLKLPYFDHRGKPLSDWPTAPPFYRIRYLEAVHDFTVATDKKVIRYVQEPNTAPCAYYPRNVDWTRIIDNPHEPIILTEGELKSAKACKEGFPTIGLGGVYNWRSHKLGLTWLPSLECITWLRRNVYVCFDSDLTTNPNVCAALHALSEELVRRGAFVHIAYLPQLDGLAKVGLDDFLVHAGPNANEQFMEILSEAEPLGLSRPLWGFNAKYVYVRNPGLIIDQESRHKISPSAFKDHTVAQEIYQERTLKADGSVSYKAVSAAGAWLRWPLRQEVAKITYQPGRERFCDNSYNIWPGWGVTPAKGDVTPFTRLIDHIFTGSEPAAKEWFIRWCAYPLQHPGTKLYSSAVIHGVKHGTGKSLIGYTLARIYGENFVEIDQDDLHNSFNEWAEGKQFVMGDDITGSNKREDNDRLKKMITQQKIRINMKYVPTYEVPDCINYYFTANHPDGFFLEDDDRRNFIHEVTVPPMSEEFYVEYDLWVDTGGAAAVFDWLLQVDLGDFNPAAPAFRTAAKERMIANVQSDLGAWVRALIATPDYILRVGEIPLKKDLFTNKELLQLYDPMGTTRTTANGLGRELSRAGVRQAADGRPIRSSDGSQARYYIIRNADQWLTASPTDITHHIAGDEKKKTKYRFS